MKAWTVSYDNFAVEASIFLKIPVQDTAGKSICSLENQNPAVDSSEESRHGKSGQYRFWKTMPSQKIFSA